MNSTIFHGLEPYLLHWEEDLSLVITFESWLCKDQLVMSWLLNSMERRIAEIFIYSELSMHLWDQVNEMYGNQNNASRVFQLKKDIANMQQEGKSFVQHLDSLMSM